MREAIEIQVDRPEVVEPIENRADRTWYGIDGPRRRPRAEVSTPPASVVTSPSEDADDAVGAVNGDLNSRRGRLQGMEPLGGMTSIKAEVPMAELLTYAQSLTSMTGGRGDYSMHFLRYEEVPTHVAQKVIEETQREREAAKA